jgi:aminocarboxymuconate-semialdehyde decarboxylase
MRIDVHAHYWTTDCLDLLASIGKTDTAAQRGLGAGGGEELQTRLELMRRAGVDMQVLSASPQMPYADDRDKAVAAARFVNDQYAAVTEGHPDHFRAFAAIPMPHINESIAELGRAWTTWTWWASRGGPVSAPGREQRMQPADQRLQPDLDHRRAD